MTELIRLNKFLSDQGICSRRAADEHILAGKVVVDGEKAYLGQKVDPDEQEIIFNNQKINLAIEDKIYYALYKPKGVVSTAIDEMGRKSVVDLVPKTPRVYPVGRLDKDSEGLILLTNDGELTNILTHPKNKHEKEYQVIVRSSERVTENNSEISKQFLGGIIIDNHLMKADKINIKYLTPNSLQLTIIIHTGYNRQIRKMCAKMGLEVIKLLRIRIANLFLDSLNIQPGQFKKVKRTDILNT